MNYFAKQEELLVALEPHGPPMTNVGTETAFRHDHCKHFQKDYHLLGSEVSWCDHRLAFCTDPKRSILRGQSSRTGTTQVDFEVDHPPPADSPPGDFLITMVKETVIIYKKSFEKIKKWTLFVSFIDLRVMKTLLTARLSVTVSSVKTWS